MRKNSLIVLFSIVLVFLLSGCLDREVLKHYVARYAVEPPDGNDPYVVYEYDDGFISVKMRTKETVSWRSRDEAERAEYMIYARKYNDLSWDMKVIVHDATDLKADRFIFTADRIEDISVTAESDWDEHTPAGSSLDDKFLFISGSPDQYIRNGYHLDRSKIDKVIEESPTPTPRRELERQMSETLYTMLPICETLSKVRFEDYQLIGLGWLWFGLMPIDKPEKGAQIRIQVLFEGGKVATYKHTCEGPKES